MIARLRGRVDRAGEGQAIIDVGGVGYLVFCSGRTLAQLPGVGEAAVLEIETHVREDHIHLYGFSDMAECEWFRTLTKVQGVGAKVALAILTVLEPEQLLQAVAAQDKAPLTRASGVGPKVAARIVAELKDKVGAMSLGPIASAPSSNAPGAETGNNSGPGPGEDAVSALVNLGYSRSDAFTVIAQAGQSLGEGAQVDDLIKAGLKALAS
jgi:holliday junction DNA helicase RuvA